MPLWAGPLSVALWWTLGEASLLLRETPTFIVNILLPVKASGAVLEIALVEVYGPYDTLVSKVPHEELQANQGENTQAEHCQDHHV